MLPIHAGAVMLAGLAACSALAAPAWAQRIVSEPPPGFEDIDDSVTTLFDFYLDDIFFGSFLASLDEGRLTIADPQAVTEAVPVPVEQVRTFDLLSAPLQANEGLVCAFGRSDACGALPAEEAGVIVEASRFRVDLFLPRAYRRIESDQVRYLPDPEPGLALVQNFNSSLSINPNSGGSGVRYGARFNTVASSGRNSLVTRVQAGEGFGVRSDQFFAQRITNTRRYSAGLIDAAGDEILQSYRIYGAEISNEDTGRIFEGDTRTRLDAVLPRRATVEVFRGDVLLDAREYPAGYNILNTSDFPRGGYPVRIVVRSGGEVLSEEVRFFSSVRQLTPPGVTFYSFRAGLRAVDGFGQSAGDGLFPGSADAFAAQADVRRRLFGAIAGGANILTVDGEGYLGGELTGAVRSVLFSLSAAAGTDGVTAISGNVNGRLGPGVAFLGGASVSGNPLNAADLIAAQEDPFLPFGPDRTQAFATYSLPLLGGNMALSGSYSEADGREEISRGNVSYARPVALLGQNAQFSLNLTASTTENRAFARLTFRGDFTDRSSWRASAGAEAFDSDTRSGVEPVGSLNYLRSDTFMGAALNSEAGLVRDRDRTQAFVSALVDTIRGSADATASVQSADGSDDLRSTVLLNGRSGWAWTPGHFQLGLNGSGDSLIVVRADASQADRSTPPPADDDGSRGLGALRAFVAEASRDAGYTVQVNDQPFGTFRPGRSVAVAVPSLAEYRVVLAPVGAPDFRVDLRPKSASLFPGNIALLEFEAQRTATVFGRLVGADGEPLTNRRVQAGEDLSLSSDNGYFTVTVPEGEPVLVYEGGRIVCRIEVDVSEGRGEAAFRRLGDVVCIAGDSQAG